MSAPFIYSPHAQCFASAGYWGHPYNPSLTSPLPQHATVYPSSPYQGPIPSDAGTPNTPERHFFSSDYGRWETPRRRRRLSWHGGSASTISPFIPPTPMPMSPFPEQIFRRSLSHTDPPAAWYPPAMVPLYSAPPFSAPPLSSSYVSGYPQFPRQLHIHPLLNGDVPNELLFDMSLSYFAPRRLVGPEQAVSLTPTDIQQPAFFPPVTKLRIVCDMIPNWPIDLVYAHGIGMSAPPVTLGDVLVAIHKVMHQRITHQDWGRLSMSQETLISRAFTRRCRKESVRHEQYHSHLELRQQGVKVVDYLHGRNLFRGLVRSEDGYVKMIVSE
ncbi:hypothetical protein GGX14DRAFT_469937 [Mycena pura]|uniref:DUF6699 domain-containing protein n=1 Tax=Mycena pura TaxID=153505 RepID=A0AAD6V3B9_9AGAR|nr:hypothetical protein GGX14DRAFT_469937 [Mycena pura]